MEANAKPGELPPLQPDQRPPIDRFCDLVLDGGVINGVVYPGFLIEMARKFRFHSLGGTSVGAIAAALAAACEYNRRFGSDNGFNEVLAKMPKELAALVDTNNEVTKIRSLFQAEEPVQRLFNWIVDLLGGQVGHLNQLAKAQSEQQKDEKSAQLHEPSSRSYVFVILDAWGKAIKHLGTSLFGYVIWASIALGLTVCFRSTTGWINLALFSALFSFSSLCLHPLFVGIKQFFALIHTSGMGMCTGMRVQGSPNAGLMEWLYEGTQKGAGLSMDRPLTFNDLWLAPAGPSGSFADSHVRAIDLRMITTCLSHGRIYELPLTCDDGTVMFRLTELAPYFPEPVMAHLRRVSKTISFDSSKILSKKFADRRADLKRFEASDSRRLLDIECKLQEQQKIFEAEFSAAEDPDLGLHAPNLRLLPIGDLPILVAARMSMSCPVLFQNLPLLGFNLDRNAEDMNLVRLWFSDGGIGSNFPIHFFDQAIPSWPTFGMKILDEPPRLSPRGQTLNAYIPYLHRDGAFDNLIYPRDTSGFTVPAGITNIKTAIKYLFSIYASAKDGHDQSYLRMPDVRNRVILAYMNNRAGNMLNLKISPEMIIELAEKIGSLGGKNAALAFLGEQTAGESTDWVDMWKDHRWVRLHMLIHGLKDYVSGFSRSLRTKALAGTAYKNSLLEQIESASQASPLRSPFDDEIPLTTAQVNLLKSSIEAIEALEKSLDALDLPQPYVPMPSGRLRFKSQI
jgi:predicted acylesterase/phospholipase RssA